MDLLSLYHRLYACFGPQGWWPGESSYEHFVGCVLAQNTRWDRVVPVIKRMKQRKLLSPEAFLQLQEEELAEVLKGSGTYRRKAEYLRTAGEFMLSLGWDGTPRSVTPDTAVLRKSMLKLRGIGPETCDSILLYVLDRPVFVVDSYTRRILTRHGLCNKKTSYAAVQKQFHKTLPADVQMFKEYHALIVECAKQYCRAKPDCAKCPLPSPSGE